MLPSIPISNHVAQREKDERISSSAQTHVASKSLPDAGRVTLTVTSCAGANNPHVQTENRHWKLFEL